MPEEPEKHSPLGASSAYRWMNCPGSVRLYGQLTERRATEYALTGTLAHLVCELCLRNGEDPSVYAGKNLALGDGIHAGNVTDAIVEGARLYVETVRKDQEKFGGKLCIEQSFSLDWLYPGMFGRNDASLVPDSVFASTRIYDYKNGRKAVSADHNVQCMYYALGALGKENLWLSEEVVCTIIQPNCWCKETVDEWAAPVSELYAWANEELLPAAKRTAEPDAPCKIGEWCCFCEAAGICPAKREAALAVLEEAVPQVEPTLPEIGMLTPEQVGKMSAFFNSDEFSSWLKALTATEADMLQRGVAIPGRKLVETIVRGNRRWADEREAVEKLKALCGADIFDMRIKSPAQVEKLLTAHKIPKKERDELVGSLVTRDETPKMIVVSDSDPRESATERTKKAIELFN